MCSLRHTHLIGYICAPMEASTGLRLLSRRLSAPQTSSSKTLFEQDFAEDPLSPEISLPLSSCKPSDKYEKFIVLLFHRQHRTRNVITNMWSVYGCFHGNLFMPSSLDITPESREQAWALKFCKRDSELLNFKKVVRLLLGLKWNESLMSRFVICSLMH